MIKIKITIMPVTEATSTTALAKTDFRRWSCRAVSPPSPAEWRRAKSTCCTRRCNCMRATSQTFMRLTKVRLIRTTWPERYWVEACSIWRTRARTQVTRTLMQPVQAVLELVVQSTTTTRASQNERRRRRNGFRRWTLGVQVQVRLK